MSDITTEPVEPIELRVSVETTHAVVYVTTEQGKVILPGQTITEEVDTTPPPGGQLPEGALPPPGSNPPRVDNTVPGAPVPDQKPPGEQPDIDNTLPPEGGSSRSPRRP